VRLQAKLLPYFARQLVYLHRAHRTVLGRSAWRIRSPLTRRRFAQSQADFTRLAIANYLQMHRGPRRHSRDLKPQIVGSINGPAVQFCHHIAALQAGFRTRTVRIDIADQGASFRRNMKSLGQIRRDLLYPNADVTPHNLTVLQNFIHDILRHVDGDGKSDALISTRAASQNSGVDANHFRTSIDQRAAGVTGIDRRVRLNEVFVILNRETVAPGGAHNAHGCSLTYAKWITDSKGVIADLNFGRIAQRNCR